jgi:hypothetical protein
MDECAHALQAGSWDCLKTMDGHKGSVNSVAVHPNGTVALSVGRCATAEGIERCKLMASCCLRACESGTGTSLVGQHMRGHLHTEFAACCQELQDQRDCAAINASAGTGSCGCGT